MSPDHSFVELMVRLRNGDQSAATRIYERYREALIALARTKMSRRVQRREDPEDVVQSVYRSFFLRQREGRFQLAGWDSLWNLLTVITARKCVNRTEYHLAKRRTAAGEVEAGSGVHTREVLDDIVGREPTPPEAAMLTETLEEIFRALKPKYRPIIELSLQGYTTEEIAARTDQGETTVRWHRKWIEQRLHKMLGQCENDP
jgi:RNA polymerase sigma-70 factor (ECF subfamily)